MREGGRFVINFGNAPGKVNVMKMEFFLSKVVEKQMGRVQTVVRVVSRAFQPERTSTTSECQESKVGTWPFEPCLSEVIWNARPFVTWGSAGHALGRKVRAVTMSLQR